MKKKNNSLFDKQLVNTSLVEAFRKLDPRTMIKNPIMFTVELVTAIMLLMLFYIAFTGDQSQGSFGYNLAIFFVLLLTILFANFAEAIAEARGKAQAESLRKTREETPAKLVTANGAAKVVSVATEKGRCVRMLRRRYDSCRRRDHRGPCLDRRERHHGRVGSGDPRSGRRQEFRDGRYESIVGPDHRQGNRQAGQKLPRQDDRAGRRVRPVRKLRTKSL